MTRAHCWEDTVEVTFRLCHTSTRTSHSLDSHPTGRLKVKVSEYSMTRSAVERSAATMAPSRLQCIRDLTQPTENATTSLKCPRARASYCPLRTLKLKAMGRTSAASIIWKFAMAPTPMQLSCPLSAVHLISFQTNRSARRSITCY